MYLIILKLLNTGKEILDDSIPKSRNYKQLLFFTTNQTISLDYKISKKGKDKTEKISIKEDRCLIEYAELPNELKDKIKLGITDSNLHSELENLHFFWIDLNRTVSKQENALVGLVESVFKKLIVDHRAAVRCLILLFSGIEVIYSQGNKAKLLDVTKRVSSEKIEETLNILTTKAKAFDEWRAEKNNVSNELGIKHFERDAFELKFDSAFDFFKDISQSEHQMILDFVKTNYHKCQKYKLGEIISELMDNFLRTNSSIFSGIDIKAIFYAAYFEAINKRQN